MGGRPSAPERVAAQRFAPDAYMQFPNVKNPLGIAE
jgi:hypothetical protein